VNPRVSVILPVYNAAQFVGEAIGSILDQSLGDLELIAIDDGSADGSGDIVGSFDDPRLVVIYNKENKGEAECTNMGLRIARGKYIARMDADDISMPRRLERQVRLLEDNPDLSACGTWAEAFGEYTGTGKPSTVHEELFAAICFDLPINSPTWMMRREFIERNGLAFNQSYSVVSDYEFWTRVFPLGRVSHVPEILYRYRIHGMNISIVHDGAAAEHANRIRANVLERMGIHRDTYEMSIHLDVRHMNDIRNLNHLRQVDAWIRRLYRANRESKYLPARQFRELLAAKRSAFYTNLRKYSPSVLLLYLRSSLILPFSQPLKQQVKFIIKCAIWYVPNSRVRHFRRLLKPKKRAV
jgi:glycosyltransferase involved in cell wall biosynthesis